VSHKTTDDIPTRENFYWTGRGQFFLFQNKAGGPRTNNNCWADAYIDAKIQIE